MNQFYYGINIKPECDADHRKGTKEVAKTERNHTYLAKQMKPIISMFSR